MMYKLSYIFDPLCGWCYASSSNITQLINDFPSKCSLIPSGLFSGSGSRKLTPDLADYAWNNDQRIHRLTGLTFSEEYQKLLQTSHSFDSTYMNRALTLINQLSPSKEALLLIKLQQARYIGGYDTSSAQTVTTLLTNWSQSLELEMDSDKIYFQLTEDETLARLTQNRHQQAQQLMLNSGISGVPTLIKQSDKSVKIFTTEHLLADYASLLDLIAQES